MISVPIDRIVPLTDARDNFSRLISDIETLSDGLYVLTKGGKPAIALINIKYLEEIMDGKIGENHESRIANFESDHKPEVSRKVHEPINRPAPVKLPEPPKPLAGGANLPKPSFEVPRIPPIPINSSKQVLGTNNSGLDGKPVPSPQAPTPPSNYDVKPTVNPTWTGEEATAKPLAPSSLVSSPNSVPGPAPKPEASSPSTGLGINHLPGASLPPIAQLDKPTSLPPPSTPSKPTINPWPIIPPRQSPTAEPLAPSSLAPSQNSVPAPTPKPEASSPSTGLGINQLPVASSPEVSYPKMVAPPPPPPPSSLPRIPSSFQTVPVPINGSKPPTTPPVSLPPPPITTAPAPFANSTDEKSLAPSSLASSQNPPSFVSVPKPVASGQMPDASSDSIAFDQPPTTIPEPGEDLPMPSAVSPSTQLGVNNQPLATSTDSVPAPKPEASRQMPAASPPPSVQDLEI